MRNFLRSIINRRMLAVLLLGFSSGLPLLLIGSTLKAWMKESGVDLTVIGFFAAAGIPYTFKFLWSPVLDRFALPWLDRRRGWILLCQGVLAALFVVMSFAQPQNASVELAALALAIAFFSATQDIAIDAWRREVLENLELGFGSSLAVNGYRLGMLLAGAGALPIADHFGWQMAYIVMASAMASCMFVTIWAPAGDAKITAPKSMRSAVIEPFFEYFSRSGALEVLVFILLYKVGDQMASDMFTPFYLDIGYSKTEIGLVSKGFGFWATIGGGLLGGLLMLRLGLLRSLWIFGILQAVSIATFSWLASRAVGLVPPASPSTWDLAGVVTIENLCSGMGPAAYVALMATLTNKRFTATQYALLSSFMGVPRVLFGTSSGYLAKTLGWQNFFLFCVVIAIPGLLMLVRANRWITATEQS